MDVEAWLMVAVGALVLVVVVSILASRIGVATPLVLVLVGIGIGYIPGVPLITVDPEVILFAVLPPLLYAAAVNVPILDLRRNLTPVGGLSVVLVIISAIIVGVLLHLVVPAIPLAAAIALGAVVAPTDAVAATAIGKRVGMPPRLVTILEGESLVNDATSLVLLRTAIAAVAGGFVFWEATLQFAYAVALAVLIGLIVGALTVWVRSRLVNPVYDTVVTFTVPFLAFAPSEYFGASGVLAVVITGLYSGHYALSKFSAGARLNERLNWRTVQFLLENGVFLIMGLELHSLVNEVASSSLHLGHTLTIALSVVAVLIVLRFAFIVPMTWGMARNLPRVEARAKERKQAAREAKQFTPPELRTNTHAIEIQRLDQRARRSAADAAHAKEQGLDIRGATILSWSGMRGVVTLAAAQSIPTAVPYRSQIVLIAFLVAIITLILHGLTLPPLVRALRPNGRSRDDHSNEIESLTEDLLAAGNAALESAVERARVTAEHDDLHEPISDKSIARARISLESALASLRLKQHRLDSHEAESGTIPTLSETQRYLHLVQVILDAQRSVLLEARAVGEYSSDVLAAATEALDIHEMRLVRK
ncbi:MAG: sodium:proton antiporter [Microbacteriaceae bacterium]|nr:sodium:proton antiporter [Microbacteriaceae bacterium]